MFPAHPFPDPTMTKTKTARGIQNGGTARNASWQGGKWIRPERRLAIYLRDGFVCCYCGRDLHAAPSADVTLDHLTPWVKGGGNDNANLVTACRSCNSARGAKPWTSYAPAGAKERIARLRRRVAPLRLAKAIIAGTTPRTEAVALARSN